MFGDFIYLKGIKISKTTYDTILSLLPHILKKRICTHFITLNANMFYEAQRQPELKGLINSAEAVTADGTGIILAARLFRQKLPERVTGYDLFKRFLMYANDHNSSIFLLGGRSYVNDKLNFLLSRVYKNIRVIGRHHGYFDKAREKKIVEAIRKAKPDFLIVSMGAFKQEIFIHNHRDEMKVPVMIGVGGAFDVMTNRILLAPKWVRKAGLEWLFRLITNPMRLIKVLKLPLFIVELIWYRIFHAKVV